LETVEACGKSLLELVNHVLDFTKLSGNTRANQPHAKPTQKCDLVRLVQEVCESSWIGQMAKKLESEQNSGIGSAYAKGSEASSPSGDSNEPQMSLKDQKQRILHEASSVETVIDISHRSLGWLVKCDAGGIRRVLMNLIGNSLKFTTAGFVHVSVREVQSTETHVVVELGVTDTGKGISRTFLEEQLFHPFTQENHLGPGTGLGLSIVNSIVQSPAINGKIDVWSTLGQGTEIRVTCELELCSQTIEGGSSLYRPTLHVDNKRSVSFVGFQENLRGQSDLKDVLRIYYEDWWKFNIANGIEGDIIVVNDNVDHLEEICAERKLKGRPLPPVIVLTGARGDGRVARACDDYQDAGGLARLLFKPAGPARLEAVTEICLQRLTGQSTGAPESHHSTPLASPHKQKEENGAAYFEDDNRTPLQDDALTPRGHPDVSVGSAATAPGIHRPVASVDLRRNSPHVSPGPPGLPDAVSLLRRHSSGSRVSRVGQRGQSPQSPSNREESLKRPVLPPRSITYHEPNLQRQVLMSPLRSPYSKISGGANGYFGSVSSNATGSSSMSTSSHEAASPSSPGSVISLEGGEGALLKSAIHTAGLLRGGVSKKRLRILSVEDNSINRKVLAAYFGKLEVDFVEAVNGQDGVDVFESHPPNYFDVIFMDLSMPILDGLGATKEIRKIEAERFRSEDHTSQYQAWSKVTKSSSSLVLSTPGGSRPSVHARAKIFTLTGRSSDEDKRKAFATGADGFIVKPLSFKVLSALLGRISARST
jgi:CheY-like chemotaxis protein